MYEFYANGLMALSVKTALPPHVNMPVQMILILNLWFRIRLLQWVVLRVEMPSLWPSAWSFARRCPVKAKSSTSLSQLAPASPSPWIPGARHRPASLLRRRPVPQRSGETPSEERSSWPRSSSHLRLRTPAEMRLLQRLWSVTNVNMLAPLRRG